MLLIDPRVNFLLKYHKFIIFFLGFSVTVISQISFKFIAQSKNLDLIVITTPIFLISFYYLFLILKTKTKFKTS